MNCKHGDLAICVRADAHPWLVGKIVRCLKLSWQLDEHWMVENPPFDKHGHQIVFDDRDLRPIRDPGDDATDEMLKIVGKPHEVTA